MNRIMTLTGVFNVFFSGKTLMADPATACPAIGYGVIVMLIFSIPMLLFPIPDKVS